MPSWFLRSAISVKLVIGGRTMAEFGQEEPVGLLLQTGRSTCAVLQTGHSIGAPTFFGVAPIGCGFHIPVVTYAVWPTIET